MIAFLQGTIHSIHTNSIIVLTESGIGYEITLSPISIAKKIIGQTTALHTYLRVTENDLSLFGFDTSEEKTFFELLLTVSGVGPKSAMSILQKGSMQDTKKAIAQGDISYLTSIQGMGKKTAERLVVELQQKIQKQETYEKESMMTDQSMEVFEALVALGYSKEEVKATIGIVQTANKTTEQMLKEVLKALSSNARK